MKLIDADKLLEYLNEHALAWKPSQSYYQLKEVIYQVESGTFDQTPPVQPDNLKPGDNVKHKHRPEWGIGTLMAAADNALVFFNARKFDDQLTECEFTELEVITDEQR